MKKHERLRKQSIALRAGVIQGKASEPQQQPQVESEASGVTSGEPKLILELAKSKVLFTKLLACSQHYLLGFSRASNSEKHAASKVRLVFLEMLSIRCTSDCSGLSEGRLTGGYSQRGNYSALWLSKELLQLESKLSVHVKQQNVQ